MDIIDTTLTFGQWVKRSRKEQEWTQDELGQKVGYCVQMIRKIEADCARPSKPGIERLAQVFDVAPANHAEFIHWARSALPTMGEIAATTGQEANAPTTESASNVAAASLPSWPTPLIGRESELAIITMLLTERFSRLLTLTGPGGIGKTRLAVQVSADLAPYFSEGVWFVGLANLYDPDNLLEQIAAASGLTLDPDRAVAAQLHAHLCSKQALLVLDNCEHLPAAAQIAALLAAAPQLTILLTSRRPLRIYGEYIFPVPALTLPPEHPLPASEQIVEYAAVRLFAERARAVQPNFALTPENAETIAKICRQLEGLPLALELAAARLRVLSPAALLARLDHSLALLTTGAIDLPARQQSLRASLDWSYALLTPEEQALFCRLAVFPAGGTLATIEALCNAQRDLRLPVLDLLDTLVAQSLVRVDYGADGEPYFVLPILTQKYAAERLADHPEAVTIPQPYAARPSLLPGIEPAAFPVTDLPNDLIPRLASPRLSAGIPTSPPAAALPARLVLLNWWDFDSHGGQHQ